MNKTAVAAKPITPPVGTKGDLPEGYTRIPKAEARIYYSRSSGGLQLHVNVGEQIMGPKGPMNFGEKIASFHPLNPTEAGGQPWGRLETADSEVIEYLEKRIVEVGDVMSATEFASLQQTPADKTRTIEDQNRLIADLQRKLDEANAQSAEGRK